jgi:hypothetical protein
VICNYLRDEGVVLIEFKADDFFYKSSRNGIEIYIRKEIAKLDGFMSFGYRRQCNMENYFHISRIIQESNVACLWDHNTELILNNKLTQSIYFAKAKVQSKSLPKNSSETHTYI